MPLNQSGRDPGHRWEFGPRKTQKLKPQMEIPRRLLARRASLLRKDQSYKTSRIVVMGLNHMPSASGTAAGEVVGDSQTNQKLLPLAEMEVSASCREAQLQIEFCNPSSRLIPIRRYH